MIFNLFKKKISAEEMATGLYHAAVSNRVKDSLKDPDGNTILTTKEQSLLLAQHLYDLMENRSLNEAKLYILTTYIANNHKIKDDNDLTVEMAISLEAFEKVRKFFKEIPQESHEFFKQKFLFDKDLNPIQKNLAMQWYASQCEIIDSVVELGMKKFKVVGKK